VPERRGSQQRRVLRGIGEQDSQRGARAMLRRADGDRNAALCSWQRGDGALLRSRQGIGDADHGVRARFLPGLGNLAADYSTADHARE
jgi:hypothetical protein